MDPNVSFSEEYVPTNTPPTPSNQSKMEQWLVANSGGLIKTTSQAKYFLIALILIAFGASLFLLFAPSSGTNEQQKARALMEQSIKASNAPQGYEK